MSKVSAQWAYYAPLPASPPSHVCPLSSQVGVDGGETELRLTVVEVKPPPPTAAPPPHPTPRIRAYFWTARPNGNEVALPCAQFAAFAEKSPSQAVAQLRSWDDQSVECLMPTPTDTETTGQPGAAGLGAEASTSTAAAVAACRPVHRTGCRHRVPRSQPIHQPTTPPRSVPPPSPSTANTEWPVRAGCTAGAVPVGRYM